MGKKKVAVLGGGTGSLSALYGLTNKPGWDQEYDITVYQLGWRLGGKGASGRAEDGRIEEHGLHVWFGFYDNAFQMIRAAYDELKSDPTPHFDTWEDAFRKQSYIGVAENFDNEWQPWMFDFPENDDIPGQGSAQPSLHDYVELLVNFLFDHAHHPRHEHRQWFKGQSEQKHLFAKAFHWMKSVAHHIELDLEDEARSVGSHLLEAIAHFGKSVHAGVLRKELFEGLEHFDLWMEHTLKHLIDHQPLARRLFLLFDSSLTIVRGLIADDVHSRGLRSLNGEDFFAWLKRHGAAEITCTWKTNALVRGLYDVAFQYVDGDVRKPAFATDAALRTILRTFFTYRGAIFWKMRAGMGDTIFTPLYLVLKNRGVKFKFFRRVHELKLDASKKKVEKIIMGRQVDLAEGVTEYDPFVVVKDLACWPAAPRYAQLKQGEALKAGNVNLESFYSDWQEVGQEELSLGQDFDQVIFGISLGGVRIVCRDLVHQNPDWMKMVEDVGTVRTQAMQLWLNEDLKGLGWSGKEEPILDAGAEPFNTWADMSHLICREGFPRGVVKNIAYFCGTMRGGLPPATAKDTPERAQETVDCNALRHVTKSMDDFWPDVTKGQSDGFDFAALVDPRNGVGKSRLEAQFFRANIDPSERYVNALPGDAAARIKPGNSGFENLFLAGDWTDNGFNAGCIEATVMSGLLCANAICGFPALEDIVGYEGAHERARAKGVGS